MRRVIGSTLAREDAGQRCGEAQAAAAVPLRSAQRHARAAASHGENEQIAAKQSTSSSKCCNAIHTPCSSTSHRCSGRCRRPVQSCLRSSRRLIHCARKSSSKRALTKAGAHGLRRINNKTKTKQNPAAARAPLADGRHLAFVSVCTLVASAAGFNERDATAGPQTSTSAQLPG